VMLVFTDLRAATTPKRVALNLIRLTRFNSLLLCMWLSRNGCSPPGDMR
jgi:hypothetical protein